ncbi:hypothetical protein [Actinosynnema sp. NPDC020468]|uniref:hypothetical protein n=1 Tax=Actinosynnema sp. NPDC020468 TaxID=3154488 RepID=UPI0033F68A0B
MTTHKIHLSALAALFPHAVAKARDLLTLGLSPTDLRSRTAPGGPWREHLPGVLVLSRRPPTRLQRIEAALRYCGPGTLVTGVDALHLHGLCSVPATGPVHTLTVRRTRAAEDVRPVHTKNLPSPVLRRGFLTAPLPRAVADTARFLPTHSEITRVLTEAFREGGVPLADLDAALAQAPSDTRSLVATLRTVPRAWAQHVVDTLPLPPPQWNVPLYTEEGRPLGEADAWWDTLALAWQLTPPKSRSHLMSAAGVVVVHTTPTQLHRDPATTAATLTRAATQATTRPRPAIHTTHPLKPKAA